LEYFQESRQISAEKRVEPTIVNNIIGAWIWLPMKRSATVPAETVRNPLPERPAKKRPMSIDCIFGATAHRTVQATKKNMEIM
jgi:hypothetical protein